MDVAVLDAIGMGAKDCAPETRAKRVTAERDWDFMVSNKIDKFEQRRTEEIVREEQVFPKENEAKTTRKLLDSQPDEMNLFLGYVCFWVAYALPSTNPENNGCGDVLMASSWKGFSMPELQSMTIVSPAGWCQELGSLIGGGTFFDILRKMENGWQTFVRHFVASSL